METILLNKKTIRASVDKRWFGVVMLFLSMVTAIGFVGYIVIDAKLYTDMFMLLTMLIPVGLMMALPFLLLSDVRKWQKKFDQEDYVIYLARVTDVNLNTIMVLFPGMYNSPRCQVFFENLPILPNHHIDGQPPCVYEFPHVARKLSIGDWCYITVITEGKKSIINVYPLKQYQIDKELNHLVKKLS